MVGWEKDTMCTATMKYVCWWRGAIRDNECGQQLFSVKISHKHGHIKKKNCTSYSYARVYIFHLEVDVTISRATGGFKSLTTKILQQSHC